MATDHEPVTEKPSGSPSSNPPDESTQNAKEEESQTAAKTRPERTANFKDYMVNTIHCRQQMQCL